MLVMQKEPAMLHRIPLLRIARWAWLAPCAVGLILAAVGTYMAFGISDPTSAGNFADVRRVVEEVETLATQARASGDTSNLDSAAALGRERLESRYPALVAALGPEGAAEIRTAMLKII